MTSPLSPPIRCTRSLWRALALVLGTTCPSLAQDTSASVTWDRQFYDLGAGRSDGPPPDLVLPMPCGGAMAFQKVLVSADADDPLADKSVRLGQSGTANGYMDYLRQDYLRGAFSDADGSGTYYYVARYELSEMQHAALMDRDCGFTPSIRMTVPQLGLSWFEAMDLARRYTEWLRSNAPEALPQVDGQPGYLRLPTETEWEYAARGGEAVDALDFGATRHPMTEPVNFYAQFDQPAAGPSGARAPNPLGLYDMLGNAEELVLEPFRLNAVGHAHGQIGGVVTRGGSFTLSEADMRSARRSEWPPFSSTTGMAQAQATFGMRLVIASQVMTDDSRVSSIGTAWTQAFERGTEGGGTPLPVGELALMIQAELDPARRQALEGMQLTLSTAQDAAAQAQTQQVFATLQMGSALLLTIRQWSERIDGMRNYVEPARERLASMEAGTPEHDDQQATIVELDARIVEFEGFVRDVLGGYREALSILAQRGDSLDAELASYAGQVQQQNNATMSVALEWLRDDLQQYRREPVTEVEALLELALD